jgi:hypothetical protein
MQARIGYILNGYVNIRGLVSIDVFSHRGRTTTSATRSTSARAATTCSKICAAGPGPARARSTGPAWSTT